LSRELNPRAGGAKICSFRAATVRGIDVLQHFQVFQLLLKCSAQSRTGLRNRALIALFYGSGIRLREALSVRPQDLDLKAGTVAIQRGKGGRRRVAAIVPDCIPILARWADVRATLALKGTAPFFCTHATGRVRGKLTFPGLPLRVEYVRVFLRRLARKAGLELRVHPHGFRHSHAVLLRQRGWDVEAVRKQLGHSSLLVTSIYLDHLGAHELPELMRKMGPVLSANGTANDTRP